METNEQLLMDISSSGYEERKVQLRFYSRRGLKDWVSARERLLADAFASALALGLVVGVSITGCSSSRAPAASAVQANAFSPDPEIDAILERSCFQCHSNSGSAPWYAAVSPTYLAANSARAALNLSDWQAYSAEKRAAELKSIEQAVRAESMPPSDYTVLDHSARLREDQKQALIKWAAQPSR